MIGKRKFYRRVKFTPEVIKDAVSRLEIRPKPLTLTVSIDARTTWDFDDVNECLSAYREEKSRGALLSFHDMQKDGQITIDYNAYLYTRIDVKQSSRSAVEHVFDAFEANAEACRLPLNEQALKDRVTMFIGHGRAPAWRDLKDHLQDKHGFKVTAYETGPRVGLHIVEILKTMEDEASFAILVMTAENEDKHGLFHARDNVIHEVGLFQGRLGFKRAIVLLEEGCAEFSNLSGVQYLPFAKGNIKETFGEVLATLKREFEGLT